MKGIDLSGRILILFDGECSLCDSLIQRVIRADKGRGRFCFAPLQSPVAGQFVDNPGEYAGRQGSLVVVKDDLLYLRSDGALVVAEAMGGLWRLAMLARALPKGVRDAIYDRVARNRELFFGRTNECMLPSPEIRKMFLERQ